MSVVEDRGAVLTVFCNLCQYLGIAVTLATKHDYNGHMVFSNENGHPGSSARTLGRGSPGRRGFFLSGTSGCRKIPPSPRCPKNLRVGGGFEKVEFTGSIIFSLRQDSTTPLGR